jgi:hypothetical protein
MKNFKIYKTIIVIIISSLFLVSCGIYKPVDARKQPAQAKDRAKKNIAEGRGVSIGSVLNRGGGGSFEFSSSNPLWRASLEILDFMPLATVDYSGGVIITDWYNDSSNANEYIKITLRFLSNEIRSDSVKVIVHSKVCSNQNNCKINEQKSRISEELVSSILTKASLIKKETKKK